MAGEAEDLGVEYTEAGSAKAHSVVWITAADIGAGPVEIPVLLVRDPNGSSVSIEFLEYVRNAASEGASREQLARTANVVGLMFDYAQYAVRSLIRTESDIETFLARFLKHRFEGTISADGSDDTALRWRPVRWLTVRGDRRHILAYLKFCLERHGFYPNLRAGAVASSSRVVPGAVKFVLAAPKTRFLAHLNRFRSENVSLETIVLPGVRTPGRDVGRRSSSANGCLSESEVRRIILHTANPVTKALIILTHFGGPRLSECIHTWVGDVLPVNYTSKLFPSARGGLGPLVVLAHPSEGTYTGAVGDRTTSRLQKLVTMGLLPRHMLPKSNKLWSGWKGMTFDSPDQFISKVIWADPEMAHLFGLCCAEILDRRDRFPAAKRHPWMFICLDTRHAEAGQPVKIAGARKAFYAACERAGIEPHRNHATIHRGRSHYVQLLKQAGLDASARSEALHQAAVTSEAAYGRNITSSNEALERYFARKYEDSAA